MIHFNKQHFGKPIFTPLKPSWFLRVNSTTIIIILGRTVIPTPSPLSPKFPKQILADFLLFFRIIQFKTAPPPVLFNSRLPLFLFFLFHPFSRSTFHQIYPISANQPLFHPPFPSVLPNQNHLDHLDHLFKVKSIMTGRKY